MGNPSESGTHLLYYFRQENDLPTALFIHPHDLFEGTAAVPRLVKGVRHIVFLDDFCGSGKQARRYSRRILEHVRRLAPRVRLSYYPLFGTSKGLKKVREKTLFDDVMALCELDPSFRALEPESRYFRETQGSIDRAFARETCMRHGSAVEPSAPLGFEGCQLLLGFAHNVPNNTLPVFWSHGQAEGAWYPVFPRRKKGEGW